MANNLDVLKFVADVDDPQYYEYNASDEEEIALFHQGRFLCS